MGCLGIGLWSGSNLYAQADSAATPCAAPAYRQFDFWIGDWEVYTGERLVGHNRVERILEGCALMENWVGEGGSKGHSFNLYNVQSGHWEQTWVDNSGGIIHFVGDYDAEHKVMRFRGTTPDTVAHKMSFWQLPEGEVRQVWEASKKGGDYRILFEGVYRKREE